MTERTIEQHDGDTVVVTTNGTPTTTTAIWKTIARVDYLTIDTTKPNKDLLLAVVETIRDYAQFWNQGTWRSLFEVDYTSEQKTLAHGLAFEIEPEIKNACGTSMCCAGWAAELVKVDWVVDGAMIRRAAQADAPREARMALDEYTDMVLVRRDWAANFGGYDGWELFTPHLVIALSSRRRIYDAMVARGFSPETHVIMRVASFAKRVLGIGNDPFCLFESGNNYDEVRRIVDAYILLGNTPTSLQAEAVRDSDLPLDEIAELGDALNFSHFEQYLVS